MTRETALIHLYKALNTPFDIQQSGLIFSDTASFSAPVFIAACQTLARRCEFFPRLHEILAACRAERDSRAQDDRRGWTRCPTCQDVGWLIHDCPGGSGRVCGRTDESYWSNTKPSYFVGVCHMRHTFTERCAHVR